MLARSSLTLLLCCTSTLAAAKEPAQVAAAQAPVARPLAARNVEPANQPGLISPGKEPDIVPPDYKRDWRTEQRFLQVGTGVSWALAGLGTIGLIVPLAMLGRCNNAQDAGAMIDCSQERRTAGIMAPILGVLTAAAIVPAVMFTRRLVKHDDRRPDKRRAAVGVGAGGLQLQF